MTRKHLTGKPKRDGLEYSCGRRKALETLDVVIGKAENQQALAEAFQREFDRDPFKFFKNVIVPLIPKDQKHENSGFQLGMTDLTPDKVSVLISAVTAPDPSIPDVPPPSPRRVRIK